MIYLAQTDTTAGFLSKDYKEINFAKKRDLNQPCIITSAYLTSLKLLAKCPNKFKNKIRRAKKTTYIHKNGLSFRLVNDNKHSIFLKDFKYLYSSSANLHGDKFNINYAKSIANMIVDDNLNESSSSTMIKLNNHKLKKIR